MAQRDNRHATKQESLEHDRRKELADFLRTRRARLLPEEIGLPRRPKRRTPGLRREEVAELIDVSVTWYTWLEQGRDIRPSAKVVESLARVLQLTKDEQTHLFQLADQPLPSSLERSKVRPAFQNLLSTLEPAPAHLRDAHWNVLAWNRAESLLDDWANYPLAERNVVWHHFAHPRLRSLMVNWEEEARTLLALFRMESIQHLDDPWLKSMIEHLQQVSEEFRQWWSFHEVQHQRERPIIFSHPKAGKLVLQPITMIFAYDQQLSLRVLLPLPETDTANKLTQLLSVQSTPGDHQAQE
ncbi:helix-turn-helix transcriptional regulator [Ktedonospora formicarum]|uniref:Transcriptional regulator n=1 Tax=Ktedonospora formicarum TaxID=2778364 RepID=A0A8J3I529_9CHLR|nr:helix-turn-helix transcriptional regulator [Ktedonospora formicarum]GHO50447.1 transcriptional regulator [Ktedonospora formicarum]